MKPIEQQIEKYADSSGKWIKTTDAKEIAERAVLRTIELIKKRAEIQRKEFFERYKGMDYSAGTLAAIDDILDHFEVKE